MSVVVPTLETSRLVLRGWKPEDAPAMVALCSDGELMRYVGGVMDTTNAWRRMAAYAGHWQLRGYGTWALEDKESGAFAGYCGIYDPDGWPEREINWGLARQFLGRGLITEAASFVREQAYRVYGFSTIASCIDLDNAPSIAVATRLGARLDRTVEFRGRAMGVFRHQPPEASR
jgi:RimJ/RimL family protein N-acetyltransferase